MQFVIRDGRSEILVEDCLLKKKKIENSVQHWVTTIINTILKEEWCNLIVEILQITEIAIS